MTVTPLQRRPPPPPELTEEQARHWRAIVDSLPADWLTPASSHLLVCYVRAIVAAEGLASHINATDPATLADLAGLRRYNKLLVLAERQTRLLASLATKLRFTQQARYTPQAAATATHKVGGPRPWEQ